MMDVVEKVIEQLNRQLQANVDRKIIKEIGISCWLRIGNTNMQNLYALMLKHNCGAKAVPVANDEYMVYIDFNDPDLDPFLIRLVPNDR